MKFVFSFALYFRLFFRTNFETSIRLPHFSTARFVNNVREFIPLEFLPIRQYHIPQTSITRLTLCLRVFPPHFSLNSQKSPNFVGILREKILIIYLLIQARFSSLESFFLPQKMLKILNKLNFFRIFLHFFPQ